MFSNRYELFKVILSLIISLKALPLCNASKAATVECMKCTFQQAMRVPNRMLMHYTMRFVVYILQVCSHWKLQKEKKVHFKYLNDALNRKNEVWNIEHFMHSAVAVHKNIVYKCILYNVSFGNPIFAKY